MTTYANGGNAPRERARALARSDDLGDGSLLASPLCDESRVEPRRANNPLAVDERRSWPRLEGDSLADAAAAAVAGGTSSCMRDPRKERDRGFVVGTLADDGALRWRCAVQDGDDAPESGGVDGALLLLLLAVATRECVTAGLDSVMDRRAGGGVDADATATAATAAATASASSSSSVKSS